MGATEGVGASREVNGGWEGSLEDVLSSGNELRMRVEDARLASDYTAGVSLESTEGAREGVRERVGAGEREEDGWGGRLEDVVRPTRLGEVMEQRRWEQRARFAGGLRGNNNNGGGDGSEGSSPAGSAVAAVRSRSDVERERAREEERIWGRGGMEREVFVRRRPTSGGRGRSGRGRGRGDRGVSGRGVSGRGVVPYNPVYAGDYLPEGFVLTYEELLSLDNGVAPGGGKNKTMSWKERGEVIRKCTTKVQWGGEGDDVKGCDECVICLEGFEEGMEVTEMRCGHAFHGRCLGRWLEVDMRCPTCRRGLEEEGG
ncbi:hypothetical protein TrRE_jg12899 [Triparma retinervis]|uniref:RING-type domain-containing protein n=1 Tax=Triparma retinervis TaxID=2557542 RepID=A0A9W6ZGQ8_9STRA|nr:hypothetical protein TrRE_jg12899 [Triparma retinervis]